MLTRAREDSFVYFGMLSAIVLGLYLSSLYSYLLFHSLVEITTIAISFTLFIIAWHAGKFLANDCLKFLGIGYAFIAVLDLLHTLAYKGMNVFPGYNANLPTQLWIAARYLQAVTLCSATFFASRKISQLQLFSLFLAIITVLAALIFSGNFPDCFVEGTGLTPFKIISEYVISAMLLVALFLFHRIRAHFSNRIYTLILSSIICTICAEIFFTAYVNVYGFANLIGHYFKLAAFYLVYRALLSTGFNEPYELIFRDLKQTETQLIESNTELEAEIAEREQVENELCKYRDELEQLVSERTDQLSKVNEQLQHELAERQQTQESLQEQTVLLEEEMEERIQAAFALDRSHESLRLVLNSLDALVYVADMDSYEVLFVNEYLKEVFGDITGKICWQSMQSGQSGPCQFCSNKFLLTPAGEPAGVYQWEFQNTVDKRWYDVHDRAIRWIDGRIVRLEIATDITKRKDAETALLTIKEELENRVRIRTADLNARSKELADSQGALLNIVDDLNAKTEELEEANSKLKEMDRLKSLFIASMSHELRTPLNSIIGFSSILHDEWTGPVNAKQKENLAIILRSGNHLLSLINDVIDVSKIEAGRIEFVAEEFDLHDLIDEAVTLVRKDIEAKGLDLQIDSLHQPMFTDKRRLLQCVLNLLSNAVKFTQQGGITVPARLVPDDNNGESGTIAEISVADTGLGISENDMKRMFQPFVRLISPLQATIPGTGLGLYLTRKLALEILKGDLLLTSDLGKGSKFTLRIPVRLS
ncbi:MAG: hypothetical protein FIA91_02105 [Geobacter sp.]|nr:hypothetical protein [Geobacter sp.]